MGEKKKSKKAGKNKERMDRYKRSGHRVQRKILKIARSNGVQYALEYASVHIYGEWARKRLANFTFGKDKELRDFKYGQRKV
jgi:hypothetical protein